MLDFFFLNCAQVQVVDKLDIFITNEEIIKAPITDFSILLGGYSSGVKKLFYVENSEYFIGNWWTNSYESNNFVVTINDFGNIDHDEPFSRCTGARPVISYSKIKEFVQSSRVRSDGIVEVEFGEYPQFVVEDIFLEEELEEKYNDGLLRLTGKTYTTDSIDYDDSDIAFEPYSHIEYEYKGNKYIRFEVGYNGKDMELSDCCGYNKLDIVWIKVEPIKWLVDEKRDIALSKNILFAGLQYCYDESNVADFNKTDIKQFMDKYFSKDIIPSTIMTLEEKQKYEEEQKRLEKRRNPYKFNLGQVSEEEIIKGAIESGVAVFLHGRSSEGKSARVKQIDPDCVIIYLRNASPESLNGKSVYNSETGEMIDVKPTWLKKLEDRCEREPDKYHIVFLDEITNALPSIQGIAFNIVLDREVNGIWKLPDNARIVAAGNDMKDSLAANQLAEPLFNRFAHVYIETKVEDWLSWASEHNIHPAIYSYIAYKKGETLRSEYNGQTPNADPRKWEMASKMLYATGSPEMLRSLVGEDITREFVEFCNQQVITLEDVINGNYTERDIENLNTAERYATAMGLSQVDEENLDKVRNFVEDLGAEFCAIFDALWTHGDESRLERILEAKLSK